MYLSNEGFGEFNFDIVCDLLRHVDIWLSEASGQESFSSRKVAIVHGNDTPMCCKGGPIHLILLTTKGNYWCQWVYQFGHEYCHHLIDGELTGKVDGLIWFEETVCELSSMYCLGKMITFCNHHTNPYLRRFAPSVQGYLDDLLRRGEDEVPPHLSIERNLHLLSQPVLHRDIYHSIARQALPLFVECPSLWKIILHFGDMHGRQSLTHLFDYLKEEADTTYADALLRLRMLLLGS